MIRYLLVLALLSSCIIRKREYSASKDSSTKKLNKYDEESYKDFTIRSKSDNHYLDFIEFEVKKNKAVGRLKEPEAVKSGNEDVVVNKKYIKKENCEESIGDILNDLYDDGEINGSIKTECSHKKKTIKTKNFILRESSFDKFANWNIENFKHGMISFLNSCNTFKTTKTQFLKNKSGENFGAIKNWVELCDVANRYSKMNLEKEFFQNYTTPFLVKDSDTGSQIGTFTGYFLYEIKVRTKKDRVFKYPIYTTPEECKVQANCDIERYDVESGKLEDRGLEILWTDSYFDLYFLQIQGSGVGVLEDGKEISIQFAGKNKYDYESIFNKIKQDSDYKNESKTFRDIMSWLREDDSKLQKYSKYNKAYVFFKVSNTPVVGSSRSVLTSARSIAVDPLYMPYGLPVWLETSMPVKELSSDSWIDFDKIVVSQDTGSAIKGKIRGDIFFGHGKKAEFLAKNTKFNGFYFMLLPEFAAKSLENTDLPESNDQQFETMDDVD